MNKESKEIRLLSKFLIHQKILNKINFKCSKKNYKNQGMKDIKQMLLKDKQQLNN